MDPLDRLILPGRTLLSGVDAVLSRGGVPQDHAIVPLMRRIGTLPGQAVEQVAELDQEAFAAASIQLRGLADRYAGQAATVNATVTSTRWEGSSGDAFHSLWQSLYAYLGTGESADEQSMSGRVVAMIGYLESVQSWVIDVRLSLARSLAEVMVSSEAVCIRMGGGGSEGSRAAADIGLRILSTVDSAIASGHQIYGQWVPRLMRLPYATSKTDGQQGWSGTTRVDLPF